MATVIAANITENQEPSSTPFVQVDATHNGIIATGVFDGAKVSILAADDSSGTNARALTGYDGKPLQITSAVELEIAATRTRFLAVIANGITAGGNTNITVTAIP